MSASLALYDRAGEVVVEVGIDGAGDVALEVGVMAFVGADEGEAAVDQDASGVGEAGLQFVEGDEGVIGHGEKIVPGGRVGESDLVTSGKPLC